MPEKINWAYKGVRSFARFWVNRFFRSIEILGSANVVNGPAIFAINHPNNLIDSMIVGYAIERKIHYLATAQLFRNRVLSLFLHNMGVIPIYRKQDDPSHGEKNLSAFQACYEVLQRGGAIGIYPEGTTHAEPRVRKIKTGAARIALEAESQFHPGIRIVPVGLNFAVRKSFRGDVTVNIGKPIEVEPYLAEYKTASVESVEKLTADLQKALEKEVIHIEEPELEKFVKDIEQLYKGELIRDLVEVGVSRKKIDDFRISKRLVEGIRYFNQQDPALVLEIRSKVEAYKNRLKRVRIQDELMHGIMNNKTTFRSFLVRVLLMIAAMPVGIWGALNHFLPYQISRWVSRKMASKETDYATVRIISGIILYPLFYAAQIWLVMKRFGWIPAIVYGATLPMLGAFAYYYWEKFRRIRGDLQLFFVMLTRKKLIEHLMERREHLIAEMDQAKERYLSATIQA
jgi:1-acyl-sn-glycerol-3-phosphate acyltransferase